MSPVFSARRRAEEFDSLVGGAPAGGRADARYTEFLEIVAALRDVPAAEPRPEFVGSLRERLMLAAQTELVATPLVRAEDVRLTLPARRPRDRRVAAAVGALAMVGATTSMAMAAQSALPGELLYPLKRAIENIETGIAVDEGERGSTLLTNAEGRLAEVSELTSEGGLEDADAIAATLVTFTDQATLASDLLLADYESTGEEASISELRDFTATSMDTLSSLESRVPVEARDELLHAAMVLTNIDSAAQQACPQCAGAGIAEIPVNLLSAEKPSGDASAPQGTRAATTTKQARKQKARPDTQSPSSVADDDLTAGVLQPPSSDDEGSSDGGGSKGSSGPVDGLTQGLTGGGSQPASSPSGLPEVEVDEDLGDVIDPLLGTD